MIDIKKILSAKYIIVMYVAGVILMSIPIEKIRPISTIDYSHGISVDIENKIAETVKETYSLKYAKVIITYDTYGEKILEYNYEQSVTDSENNTSKTYQKSSVSDKENNQPFVKTEKLPSVRGVLVSVSCVDDETIYDIRSATATLLGVSVNKVNVICGKE